MTPDPTAPLLSVDDLVVQYHRSGGPPTRAVAGVSLQVRAGEVVGLVGESGCGKSTLARAVCGLTAPAEGRITYDGTPVRPLRVRRRELALTGIQMVFQDPYGSLNPRRRVGSQIADGIRTAAGRGESAAELTTPEDLLTRVGLPASAAERYPQEFSGGQRQRIAIARALAARPRLLVGDEPISALDASAQLQVATLMRSLAVESGAGLLFISHDLSVVRLIADRIAVMYLGRIVETGPTAEVWADPRHPYTRALLAAVPKPDGAGVLPAELPGDVPDPADPPSGCRFHPRCPQAFDGCDREEPQLIAGGVACRLYAA
ncbi:oligopeptide/dipeptide ABC transporter ATP-binding protein [Streptomyces prunicolor]|uniref:ABC transporter ATP-binding protein n=1 Tax=Streptomyces prunicolor TaxID=67348 RepID=A0ABU4FC56_9ACTN|nr:ABC transporter ATP-binding protein [Streptomyces prunicolor]MCX5243518.1 ABC transporter ATP-binding protein [Streptomyces prunicolor]MDV7217598.1 ABC transporter ATP-binding protein [Streptomyces prunicolor]